MFPFGRFQSDVSGCGRKRMALLISDPRPRPLRALSASHYANLWGNCESVLRFDAAPHLHPIEKDLIVIDLIHRIESEG